MRSTLKCLLDYKTYGVGGKERMDAQETKNEPHDHSYNWNASRSSYEDLLLTLKLQTKEIKNSTNTFPCSNTKYVGKTEGTNPVRIPELSTLEKNVSRC